MNIFNIRKNVRVKRSAIMRLMSRGIVDKSMIRGTGNYIVFNSITPAYAKRINSICDIEVESDGEWIFVRHMDSQSLENIYKNIKEKEIKDEPIEKIEEAVQIDEPETEEEKEPVDEKIEEAPVVTEETDVHHEEPEQDDIAEEEPTLEAPAVDEDANEEIVEVEEDVVEDDSGTEDFQTEEVSDVTTSEEHSQNNYNRIPKNIKFKKRKKK